MAKYAHATLGSDSNDGTIGSPYQTVRKLADNLTTGETGYCRGGTFTGIDSRFLSTDTFWNMANGSSGAGYTTIKAYDNEPVVWTPLANTHRMIGLKNGNTYWSFEDIEMVGQGNDTTETQMAMGSWGSTAGSHIKMVNCHVRNFRWNGILLGGFTDCQITDGIVDQTGLAAAGHAFYISNGAHRTTIARMTISNSGRWAIHHYSSSGQADDCRYYDNRISNYGMLGTGEGILILRGSGNWAWNNVVFDAQNAGSGNAYINYSATNTRFVHNIAYNVKGRGYYIHGGTGILLQNSIALGCTAGAIFNNIGGNLTQTTNLTSGTPTAIWVDPLSDKNFHLLEGASTVRGQGTYHADFATDKDSVVRPNPSPDIGPYQYVAAGGGTPPVNIIPDPRTTMVNVAISFSSANITGSGLTEGLIYVESGSLS